MQLPKILTPPPSSRLRPFIAACAAVSLLLVWATPLQAQDKADETLLQMRDAFRKADKKKLTALLPQTRGHALEPWAAYWELSARIGEAAPSEVQAFLTRYAGSYQEDRLRNDWLLLLGQRRDWTTFAAEYPRFRMNDDKEVRCYALLVEHLTTGANVAAEVRRHWYAQREEGDGCTLAADRLRGAGQLDRLDIWRKARLAMEANRPRAARAAVQIEAPDVAPHVAEINTSAARYLSHRAAAPTHKRQELVLLALIKIASNDPDQAASLLDAKWSSQFTAEERNWAWGAIGRQAAVRLQDNASDYFAKVSRDADLPDDMLAWKVRAALRQGQWKVVLATTQAMSQEARTDPTWTYWRARALLAGVPEAERQVAWAPPAPPTAPTAPAAAPITASHAAQPAPRAERAELKEARQLLESIASLRGFYEKLALEELGQRITTPARPAPPTAEEKDAAERNPGLTRALRAIAIGLRAEGVREWNYHANLHTPGGLSDRELLAAAQRACDNGVWDRCINTSERSKSVLDYAQRFPMPFQADVVRRAREIELDPAYVYGLIRQESRFVMDARSHVGASGLMQVMPATAKWTAKKIGLTGFTPGQITERDTNIAIGTGYLKLVLDDFGGSLPLAAAAYNAGPSRSRAWRNGPVLEGAIWAENVPFNETRDYVKKVLSNTTDYAAVLTGQPQSLKARLGTVGPRGAGTTENRDLP